MSRANTPIRKLRRRETALYNLERRKTEGAKKEKADAEIVTLQFRIAKAKALLNIST